MNKYLSGVKSTMKVSAVSSTGFSGLQGRQNVVCMWRGFLWLFIVSVIFMVPQMAVAQNKTIVILAPHSDDEALCCAGVIYSALQQGDTVKVVVVTNGDYYSPGVPLGYERQAESVAAMGVLGLTEQDVIFFGYGDQTLQSLYQSTSPTTLITSAAGQTQTYGNRGLGGVSYHQYVYGVPGEYNRQTILQDMESMLQNLHPDEVYTTGLWDDHPDHRGTFNFLVEALLDLKRQGVALTTRVHETLVHPPCESCGVPSNANYMWPGGGPGILPSFVPTQPFSEPYYLNSMTPYTWTQIESIPVPAPMLSPIQSSNLKAQVISQYVSQGASTPTNYLFSFVKMNEIFWIRDFSTNIAGLASVSASSQDSGDGSLAASAVDGFIEGDPGYAPWEWVTNGQLAGAWINLAWPRQVTISQVVLYNRQDGVDEVISGVLQFSDGSTVPVGQLPINGNGTLVSFAPKTVTSMKFTVGNAVGQNIGLTEIEVFGEPAGTTINHPQIFQGPVPSVPLQTDQYGQPYTAFISDAQTTTLNVTAFDVDARPLDYAWASSVGTMTGNGPSVTFNPPIVANPTLVSTTVTVSDGQGGTAQNNTYITVTPSNSSGISVSSLALNPTSVASGSSALGIVTLSGAAPQGAVVSLSNTNSAIATIPATVLVSPGKSTANFQISTTYVASTTSLSISASLGGATQNAVLTVLQPPVTLSSLSANPPTIGGSNPSTGILTLSGPALAGGAVVALSSNQTSVATVPASVTVPAGATSVTFPITTQALSSPVSVTISANYVGGTIAASLRVAPYVAPNLATIASVSVSSETPAYQQLGIKAIDGIVDGSPAPGDYTREWATNGQLAGAWIKLTWTGPVATSQVMLYDRPNLSDNIIAGTLSFSDGSTVPVGTLPNNGVPLTVSFAQKTVTWVQFTVNTAVGQNIGLAEIAVLGTVAPTSLGAVTLTPAAVSGGTPSTGTVTLNGPAPSGGAVVALNNSNSSVATTPASVTVPSGANSATFTVTTSVVSSTTAVAILGSYNGNQGATLTVNPLTVAAVSLSPSTISGSATSTATVTLNGVAPTGGAVVSLSSSNTAAAQVPTTVTIPGGSASSTFAVTTSVVSTQVAASISATYNGTQSATLTINPIAIAVVSVNPTMLVGGTSSIGTVTLNGVASSGAVVVSLLSSNTSAATVPPNVTISAGSATGTFSITTNTVSSTASVVISGTYNATQSATLLVTPAVSGGSGMQQFASDSFTRPDGSMGTNWTTVLDSGSPPTIASQQIQSVWGSAEAMYYGGINWPADQYAQARIGALGNGSIGPAVRMTSSGYFYAGTVGSFGTGNANVYILLDSNGSRSVIASSSTATVVAGDYLQLSATGTSLTLTNVTRSTTLLMASDSSVTAGYPGFYVGGSGTTLSDWSAGLANAPVNSATLATDNFNRANAPNLGVNWAVGSGLYAIQIVNDQIESAGQGQPPGQGHGKEYYVGVSFPSDQWSQAQVISSHNDVNGAIVRYQGSSDTHYVGFVSMIGPAGTCSINIERDINGAPVVLAADSTYCAVSAGDYMRLQVQGSLLSYIDATSGALLLTVLDTQITGGSPGWSLNPAGGTPTAANWSGGSFQ